MTFISFAQNFEDVMLWRALNHIEKGFYIDIGAWYPVEDSVTKAFYDRGWSGINIEPEPFAHSKLVKERPRDINLDFAVSDKQGEAYLYKVKKANSCLICDTGLSTLRDDIIEEYLKPDYIKSSAIRIAMKRLSDIWKEYVPSNQEVHFLKIDVEGSEGAVLLSNDWSKFRPWIIVIESSIPNTQQQTYAKWEHILLDKGYLFTYEDGLNRFYVADEHNELLKSFKYPPNIFDDFRHYMRDIVEENAKLELEHEHYLRLEGELKMTKEELQKVYLTYSWRITHPLRVAFISVTSMRSMLLRDALIIKRCIEGLLGSILANLIRFVLDQPSLKIRAKKSLQLFPALEQYLFRFAKQHELIINSQESSFDRYKEFLHLALDAQIIYEELKDAIERKNRRSY